MNVRGNARRAAVLAAGVSMVAGALFGTLATGDALAATTGPAAHIGAPDPPHGVPSCSGLLAAYRLVSREAGVVIGSRHTRGGSPARWADQLYRAGDLPLSYLAARAGNGDAANAAFVMALTASADAALAGPGCDPGGVIARGLPGWFYWAGTSDRDHGSRCIVVWGNNRKGARPGASAEICGDGAAYPYAS